MSAPKQIHVGWVFGLARSGSSITAYASAAPWGLPVADEIMGPWDRTGEPYNYPPEQARLVEMFKASQSRLTPEVAAQTRKLLEELARKQGADRIVSKHPHLRFTPEEMIEQFPSDRGVWLIRNPLRRLASIHARGWTSIVRPNHDLDYFREYAERWLNLPDDRTLVFESLKRDPRAYFGKIYSAWGWAYTEADIDKAIAYQRAKYHGASGEVEADHTPRDAVSERARSVPTEAVELYLRDPFMRDLFNRLGWSLRKYDYCERPPTPLVRLRRKLRTLTQPRDHGS
ncbi:MAG: sulfotransferase [Phycisphaerales bacterium]|nr:sulfotransferase [Phycisphaerales bacterium]MCB9835108.1 sulfotransferase [Phycisphaera sp.]